jgi:hypothetical protein
MSRQSDRAFAIEKGTKAVGTLAAAGAILHDKKLWRLAIKAEKRINKINGGPLIFDPREGHR